MLQSLVGDDQQMSVVSSASGKVAQASARPVLAQDHPTLVKQACINYA